jgi:hypothetical protein
LLQSLVTQITSRAAFDEDVIRYASQLRANRSSSPRDRQFAGKSRTRLTTWSLSKTSDGELRRSKGIGGSS